MVVSAVRRYTFYDQGSLSTDTYDFIEDARRAYGDDVPFYTELCGGAGRILELGAGTGRVAWALAQAGYEVCGLDLSRGMLARAEAKRKRMPSVVQSRSKFVQGDMAGFSLPEKFDRILVPYRSFNHLTTPEQQIGCLQSIRRHLAPGGLGAVHLAMIDYPDKMVDPDELEKTRHIRVRAGTGNKLVHWEIMERKVDLIEQILEQEVRFTYRVIDGPILRTDISTYRICWITRREARHLFARCGLVITAEYSDFAKSPPRLDADHIILFRAAD
jgi:SAM-dependent methyltransferase